MELPKDDTSLTHTAPDVIMSRLAAAQLQKLELEISKLHAEVKSRSRINAVVALTPLLSIAIGVAGFAFGVYQFNAQQVRILEEQRKADVTSTFGHKLQLQNRIRSDVETLLQFFNDSNQTLAAASFRLADLNTNLALSAQSTASDGQQLSLTDRRTITISFVRAIEDDCKLTSYRHAAFVRVLAARWPDYAEFLKDATGHARLIAEKYADAAYELQKLDPEPFAHVSYDSRAGLFIWPQEYAQRAATHKRHFYDLVLGFQEHVRLIPSKEEKAMLVARFAHSIGNDQMAAQLAPAE